MFLNFSGSATRSDLKRPATRSVDVYRGSATTSDLKLTATLSFDVYTQTLLIPYITVIVEHSTHEAMQMIHAYTPKFNVHDKHRVATAVAHYEPYLDFDELLRRTSEPL